MMQPDHIPQPVADYCITHRLVNPRITQGIKTRRALATDANGEVVFIPSDVFCEVV